MTDKDCYLAAVALRTSNSLSLAAESAADLWESGYQTSHCALLIANLFLDLGQYESALIWHTRAYSLASPTTPHPSLSSLTLPLAYSRMRLGQWSPETWKLWEHGRVGKSWNPAPATYHAPTPFPQSPLLILSEGGYGDAFLFTRFFRHPSFDPLLRANSRFVLGPNFSSLQCLHRDNIWDGMPTIWPQDRINWASFTYSTALMSVLGGFNVGSTRDIPSHSPLRVDPKLLHKSSYGTGPRIGLCWKAEEKGVQKHIRSIAQETELLPLQNWRMVSLIPEEKVEGLSMNTPILQTWMDTARTIAGLDLVITVDTAVAHLAGLLGVRALILLPLAVDWKWGVTGSSSYWWPSATLIRNTSPYNWNGPIQQVVEILEKEYPCQNLM